MSRRSSLTHTAYHCMVVLSGTSLADSLLPWRLPSIIFSDAFGGSQETATLGFCIKLHILTVFSTELYVYLTVFQERPVSLVSCPAYFSHAEGKNSLVNGLFRFCSVRFKNWWRHVFKNVLCDVTQVMTLWNSAKETVRSRDHPSRGFRTPRNEDSQNLKPLPTSEALRRSYRHLKLRNFTLPVGKLRSTYRAFMEVLAFLRWSSLWFCLA